MPAVRRQFAIDNDLKRYEKALSHLHSLGAFEELKQYAEKHEMHNAAIELYKYQDEQLRQLMRLYADFLNSRNRFKEAGIGRFTYSMLQAPLLMKDKHMNSSLTTSLPFQHILPQ
jgi:hypothetical protein